MFQTVFGGRQYPSEVCESWTCKIKITCHERREYYWPSNLIAAWLFKRMCIFPASEWFILGDLETVSRAGRNGATNVFKHGRKSPWVPTLIGTFPNGQANTGSWLGTKKCFVLLCSIGEQHLLSSFCEFVHTAIDSITACLAHAPKKCTQSGNFQFDINSSFQNTVYPKTKDAFPKIQAWAYNRYSRLHRSRLRKY